MWRVALLSHVQRAPLTLLRACGVCRQVRWWGVGVDAFIEGTRVSVAAKVPAAPKAVRLAVLL